MIVFGCLSASFKKINPKAKKTVNKPTAKLIVPPANLTPAITAEPKNEAPFEKISYIPKYSPEFSAGIILE